MMPNPLLRTYNTYAWPNRDSYRGLGVDKVGVGPNGTPMYGNGPRRGCLVSVNRIAGSAADVAIEYATPPTYDYALVKRFQFNPPNVPFQVQASAAVPAGSEAPGSELNGGDYVLGNAQTELVLMFNRELEVFRAKNNHPDTPREFGRLGVQLDVMDIIKVILGAKQVEEMDAMDTESVGYNITPGTDSGAITTSENGALSSVGSLHRYLFDTMQASEGVNSHPVGWVVNNDMAFYGSVNGMSYDFQKFTKDMVPTVAAVSIGLVVSKAGTASYVSSMFGSSSSVPAASFASGVGASMWTPGGTTLNPGGVGPGQFGMVAV